MDIRTLIPWAVTLHRNQIKAGKVIKLEGHEEAYFIASIICEWESDAKEWMGMFKARCLGLVEMYGGRISTHQLLNDAWKTCRTAFGHPRRASNLATLDINAIYKDAHKVLCPQLELAEFAKICWQMGWGKEWIEAKINTLVQEKKLVLILDTFFFQEDFLKEHFDYQSVLLKNHINADNKGMIELIDEIIKIVYD